jgi:hypothetical protein
LTRSGLICFRIGTGGLFLWMWQWISGCHKMQGIPWLVVDMLALQEVLCFMVLVKYSMVDASKVETTSLRFWCIVIWQMTPWHLGTCFRHPHTF